MPRYMRAVSKIGLRLEFFANSIAFGLYSGTSSVTSLLMGINSHSALNKVFAASKSVENNGPIL